MFTKTTKFDILAKVITKVEVAALISGLEEASSRLGVNISSLLHQQLHILLTASLYSDVQRCLACRRKQPRRLVFKFRFKFVIPNCCFEFN